MKDAMYYNKREKIDVTKAPLEGNTLEGIIEELNEDVFDDFDTDNYDIDNSDTDNADTNNFEIDNPNTRKEQLEKAQEETMPSAISSFLSEIAAFPVLTAEEEVDLFQKLEQARRDNDTEAYQKIKQRIYECNLKLVVSIAKKYSCGTTHMDIMDLIMEGAIGLNTAIERFEYKKGNKFSTYATWWIRQGMTRELINKENVIRIPVHRYEAIYKINRFIAEYKQSHLGQDPTYKEIAEGLAVSEDFVRENLLFSMKTVSLNAPTEEPDHGFQSEMIDFIPDLNAEKNFSKIESEEFLKIINDIIDHTWTREGFVQRERNKEIIYRRFGLNGYQTQTLYEIGLHFNLSRERVRQIESRFIKKCRNPKYTRLLKEYAKELF